MAKRILAVDDEPSVLRFVSEALEADHNTVETAGDGVEGLKKFYVRAEARDLEVRGITILWDQATQGIMDPLVVAMSSAFAPFPGSGIAALLGPPPRRKVDYGTGIVVSAGGHILADRQVTDGCNVIEVSGHGAADLITDDAAAGLSLLRIYGASDLVPAALAQDGARAGDLTLLGIADPQTQGGGRAVSTVAARVTGEPRLRRGCVRCRVHHWGHATQWPDWSTARPAAVWFDPGHSSPFKLPPPRAPAGRPAPAAGSPPPSPIPSIRAPARTWSTHSRTPLPPYRTSQRVAVSGSDHSSSG